MSLKAERLVGEGLVRDLGTPCNIRLDLSLQGRQLEVHDSEQQTCQERVVGVERNKGGQLEDFL